MIRPTHFEEIKNLYRFSCTVHEYVSPGVFAIAAMNFRMYTKMMLYLYSFPPSTFLSKISGILKGTYECQATILQN